MTYQELKDDCFNHGLWVHDRIHINTKPIAIAFLGSSHTVNGINDEIITENISVGQAVNLGYCRFGRNLNYVLLKEVILKKNVKHLILEVREHEDRYSHPVFPFIAESKDVVLPNLLFNRKFIGDLWAHFTYKIEIFQDKIYQHEPIAVTRTHDFGFASSADTASTLYLDEVKLKRSVSKPPLAKLAQDFHSNFARVYLRKISELCHKNKIKITFLYMPSYGILMEKPFEFETYSKYGRVLLPPKNIYENQANWFDDNHLNQAGAKELSLWLAEQINNPPFTNESK